MGNIVENLNQINTIKENIKTSILSKGGDLTGKHFEDYPSVIDGLSGGAGVEFTYFNIVDSSVGSNPKTTTFRYNVSGLNNISSMNIKMYYSGVGSVMILCETLNILPLSQEGSNEYSTQIYYDMQHIYLAEIEYIVDGETHVTRSFTQGVVCFPAGTKVMVSLDGKTKNIEDIEVGDNIVTFNTKYQYNWVVKVQRTTGVSNIKRYIKITLTDGTELNTSAAHPIYTLHGYAAYKPHLMCNGEMSHRLSVGEKVLCDTNGSLKFVEVTNIEEIVLDEGINMYSVQLEDGYENFYANNMLVLETNLDAILSYKAGVGGNAEILLSDGTSKCIKDIETTDKIIAVNKYTGKEEECSIKSKFKSNCTHLVNITFEDDKNNEQSITVAPGQAIYTREGWKTIIDRVLDSTFTDVLQVGDVIERLDKVILTVKSIDIVSGTEEELYDLDVDDNFDNFMIVFPQMNENGAGGGGAFAQYPFITFLVHNSVG